MLPRDYIAEFELDELLVSAMPMTERELRAFKWIDENPKKLGEPLIMPDWAWDPHRAVSTNVVWIVENARRWIAKGTSDMVAIELGDVNDAELFSLWLWPHTSYELQYCIFGMRELSRLLEALGLDNKPIRDLGFATKQWCCTLRDLYNAKSNDRADVQAELCRRIGAIDAGVWHCMNALKEKIQCELPVEDHAITVYEPIDEGSELGKYLCYPWQLMRLVERRKAVHFGLSDVARVTASTRRNTIRSTKKTGRPEGSRNDTLINDFIEMLDSNGDIARYYLEPKRAQWEPMFAKYRKPYRIPKVKNAESRIKDGIRRQYGEKKRRTNHDAN